MSEKKNLRSARWYEQKSMRGSAHRQRTLQLGFRRKDFIGKPVIGLINSWDEFSTCHGHLKQRADDVRRGVWSAGGFPAEIPVLGLGEVMIKPTSMIYRNLLAMQVEEMIRAHPLDAVVLMGGCDKTTVGLIMGALSVDIPMIFMPAGPMLNSNWHNVTIGAGTHTRKYWDELRAGTITEEDWEELEERICRSHGTCNTMGTASTMTCIIEALGLTLPHAVTIPAVDSSHARMAADCGERIVEMAGLDKYKPSNLITKQHFYNAITTFMALGGSTNAAVHFIAMAGRAGIDLSLDDISSLSKSVPVIVDLLPAGRFLMEDLHNAGGVPAIMQTISKELNLDVMTVNGKTLGENLQKAHNWNPEVIRPLDNPISHYSSMTVLHGNLAPSGAVIKASAATESLLKHRGKAVVFENYPDLYARIDDVNLDVDENSVLVLKSSGPKGAPGMPEWGGLPIPKKLLEKGVRDIVRISDARMSGTHFGTVVLHVAPESAVGGPLALVKNGDFIELDVANNSIHLDVSEEELNRRKKEWEEMQYDPAKPYPRGYTRMYIQHVTQADRGCDLDFLEGRSPDQEPDIY